MTPLKKWAPLPLAVEMDMTPMIDIVFQQLIFFMLTSAFVFQPGVKIHLPKAVTAEVTQRESIVIAISKSDNLYLDSRLVTLQELQRELPSLGKKQRPILIRSDRQASMGRVVEVWDMCRALGIQQVNIATSGETAVRTRGGAEQR